MRTAIHYICHSGFLVETPGAALLFDYSGGSLPTIPRDKPLFVFASHSHGDHFQRGIYNIDHSNTRYILSQDIKYKGFPEKLQSRIRFVKKHEAFSIDELQVSTLRSTDKGVAFCVELPGLSIYHAGDLNHWFWKEEQEDWNLNMEAKYRAELARIKGHRFDLAFVPLDPRLEEYRELGLRIFLEYCGASCIFPMHMWGEYSAIAQAKKDIPGLISIEHENEDFAFDL